MVNVIRESTHEALWNKAFFPDPAAFLRWCKEQGLKLIGVGPTEVIRWQQIYEKQARKRVLGSILGALFCF